MFFFCHLYNSVKCLYRRPLCRVSWPIGLSSVKLCTALYANEQLAAVAQQEKKCRTHKIKINNELQRILPNRVWSPVKIHCAQSLCAHFTNFGSWNSGMRYNQVFDLGDLNLLVVPQLLGSGSRRLSLAADHLIR